jgi:hypothetical protein
MNAIVVINAQHNLLDEQRQLLEKTFDSFEELKVPAEGWGKPTILAKAKELAESDHAVVILSPIPLLLGKVAASRGGRDTYVFHNDRREKKDLPNGKIISVVAQTGWELFPLAE